MQFRLEASRINRTSKLLNITIREDLKTSIELYNQLIEGWKDNRVIWFNLLNELEDSRTSYERNRDYLIYFENEGLRDSIARYYRKSSNLALALRNGQQRIHDIHLNHDEPLSEHQQNELGELYKRLSNLVLDLSAAITESSKILTDLERIK